MKSALALIETQLGALVVNADVAKRVEGRLSKTQREYILRQQMQAIREELGEADGAADEADDLDRLHRRLHAADPPPETLKAAEAELRKLRKMTEQAPAYGTSRAWVETVASLPWSKEAATEAREVPISEARAILDAEHYGLDKVKDRIVEYLAVRSLRPEARPPILCFSARPASGRRAGEVHRRDAVAAVSAHLAGRSARRGGRARTRRTHRMPGRLINGVKRVGVKDPVMLLDEIDKMGADWGDPAGVARGARPGTESQFTRSCLGVPFDLPGHVPRHRQRRADHPGPLRDRMEMIDVPGYTAEEKHKIAPRVHRAASPRRTRPRATGTETSNPARGYRDDRARVHARSEGPRFAATC